MDCGRRGSAPAADVHAKGVGSAPPRLYRPGCLYPRPPQTHSRMHAANYVLLTTFNNRRAEKLTIAKNTAKLTRTTVICRRGESLVTTGPRSAKSCQTST